MEQFALDLDPVTRAYVRETNDPIETVSAGWPLRYRKALGWLDEIEAERLRELMQHIPSGGCWINSDRHHLTYPRVAAQDSELTYVHVDSHHDRSWLPTRKETVLLNGSFVGAVEELDHVKEVVMVGAYHPGVRSCDQRALLSGAELPEVEGPVYLSVDADVLSPDVFPTKFCQGFIDMDMLEQIIDRYRDQAVAGDLMGLSGDQPDANYAVYDRIREML